MSMKLELRFETAQGKNRVISIDQPKTDLTEEAVQSAMEQIVTQDMFTDKGDKLFAKIKGARYVTRTVEDIIEA
ncbi:DUF2922 domain-containing protein [Alkalibacterium olivapovliticus]|uniref:DUF2922 family protein n=1 Tax=Alkalibacterium olivapovliticus TaxID=99907 RepID=A0A2T0W079_9LACT|nr:DUF2922 domain-containing protein [Alkalibacterium olivapovliticus]PRY78028.1 Protein of unknown function (DUF2922) [Alkalibacterium olivapovliticus]